MRTEMNTVSPVMPLLSCVLAPSYCISSCLFSWRFIWTTEIFVCIIETFIPHNCEIIFLPGEKSYFGCSTNPQCIGSLLCKQRPGIHVLEVYQFHFKILTLSTLSKNLYSHICSFMNRLRKATCVQFRKGWMGYSENHISPSKYYLHNIILS